MKNNDVFEINGIRVTCFHTPCHTRGSTLFFFEPIHPVGSMHFNNERVAGYQVVRNVDKCVFTGDTIFIGSIGVFFEGEAKEMVHACSVMREKMPHDTKMFCGHEYSVSNLEFCLKMDPKNVVIQAKLAELKALREACWFTVPATIREELQHNVFMRCLDDDM